MSTTVPTALEASDLGIVSSDAGTSNDGLALNLWVSAQFEADNVTSDDLRTMLQLVVDNTGLDGVDELTITATEASGGNPVDLGTLGGELGFAQDDIPEYDDLTDFEAPWDDVVDFLDE